MVNTELGGTVTPGGVYEEGTVVTITATPKTNWKFDSWLGDKIGTENPIQITMDKSKKLTAYFKVTNPFYLDDNGVTIKAIEGVTAGTTGQFNGITYVAVDRNMLIEKLRAGGDVSKVVTTLVTNMKHPYDLKDLVSKDFNQDISSWDVSNVTNMEGFFLGAHSFNQDIGNWDVSKVINMRSLFIYARAFNQDISKWDVSNVTNMQNMFYEAYHFNKDISSWNTSNVTNMSGVFCGRGDNLSPPKDDMEYYFSNFNQDIGNWDVKKVTNMQSMFQYNNTFNQDISKWDVSAVTDMQSMFQNTKEFNQDIGNWDVSKVVKVNSQSVSGMFAMFGWAKKFNQDLSKWCVTNNNEKPSYFNHDGVLESKNYPIWGTCPSD